MKLTANNGQDIFIYINFSDQNCELDSIVLVLMTYQHVSYFTKENGS